MPRVEIYTKPTCSYCFRAKRLLESKGLAYEEHVVEHGSPMRAEMIQRSGRMTVPQIFIGERHIGGCEDLVALEMRGKLDELLAA